jgi:ATP-dependent exoDNAse (exonuclease V) beta subunit
MMLAEKNVFFSGDTAQTIAKGVGFRFFDLKQVFTRQNYDSQTTFQVPKVLQLVKNFRSHARILDLANSVVSLLELLFPKTIDKLQKESSDNDGPRPLVIDHHPDQHALSKLLQKYLLFGSVPSKQSKQGSFGCTQVVIVRD